MGRRAAEYLNLADGTLLAVGFKDRDGIFRCRFKGPDGKPVELSTGVYVGKWKPGQRVPGEVILEASKLIVKAYRSTQVDIGRVTWKQVEDAITSAPELRERTAETYRSALRILQTHVPDVTGPPGITPEVARQFRTDYARGTFSRSTGKNPKMFKRSPKTIENALRRLTGLWNKLIKWKLAIGNPWAALPRPTVPKKPVRVPTEATVAEFMAWLRDRYPGWDILPLFCEVKALAGCRTLDLCSVRSDQLKGGKLVITPETDKTHRERTIPLPADLSHKLEAIKGPVYLWESYTAGARKYRPGTRNRDEFEPSTLFWAVNNVFREWSEAHPDKKLTPHDLRRRAITLTTLTTQSVDATAQALGLDPSTARRYYLDAKQAFDGEKLLTDMADILRPRATDSGAIVGRSETPKSKKP